MAKKSSIEKNNHRRKLVSKYEKKRSDLKSKIKDRSISLEERLPLIMTLAKMPRNGAKCRVRNRCVLTGRPRGYYRQFDMSRIALREHGSEGKIPGLVKSSW